MSPQSFLPSFESTDLSVKEKFKLYVQDSHPILPTKFRVSCPFGSGEDVQNKILFVFSSGGHFVNWNDQSEQFSLFLIYKSPRHFLPSFEHTIRLSVEKKFKIDCQNDAMAALLDFDPNAFRYILSTSHPDTSHQVSSQLAFPFRRSSIYIFMIAAVADISDLRSERFELSFICKSPSYFLPNFESTGLSVQEKSSKYIVFYVLFWRPFSSLA